MNFILVYTTYNALSFVCLGFNYMWVKGKKYKYKTRGTGSKKNIKSLISGLNLKDFEIKRFVLHTFEFKSFANILI